MNDYTGIIEIVLSLLSAIITAFIIPLIRKKLSAEEREKLQYWVGVAVNAAEQYFGSKTGEQKKEYVVNFLTTKSIAFDAEEVEALIEAEVYKLSMAQKYTFPDSETEENG